MGYLGFPGGIVKTSETIQIYAKQFGKGLFPDRLPAHSVVG